MRWNAKDVFSKRVLEMYGEALQRLAAKKRKPQLVEMDRWVRGELRANIAARNPKHITQEELVRVVEWKLTRGIKRPRMLQFAQQLTNDAVTTASEAAFLRADDGDIEGALMAMQDLRGTGVATASAVLSAASPDVPFMSDALMQVILARKDYKLRTYTAMLEATQQELLDTQARQDAADEAAGDGSRLVWTAELMEKAAWAAINMGLRRPDAVRLWDKRKAKRGQDEGDDSSDEAETKKQRTDGRDEANDLSAEAVTNKHCAA